MGGRRKNSRINEAAFKELDRVFRANEGSDALVRAFNTLCADDRALMLAYIAADFNKTTLVKQLGVSWPVLDDRLWRIQVVVKERYEKMISEADEF